MFNWIKVAEEQETYDIYRLRQGHDFWYHIYWTLNADVYVSFVEHYGLWIDNRTEMYSRDNHTRHLYGNNSLAGRFIILLKKLLEEPNDYRMCVDPKICGELVGKFCQIIATKGLMDNIIKTMIDNLGTFVKYLREPWLNPLETRDKQCFNAVAYNDYVVNRDKGGPLKTTIDMIKLCTSYSETMEFDDNMLNKIIGGKKVE